MIESMIEALTSLRVSELEEGDTHPTDLPREGLVDRLTMVDSLVRGERGEKRAEDINTVVEARARLAFAQGGPGKHRGKTPIAVGDRVRMSGTFLRNTGQYFKTLETEDKGTVEILHGTKDWQLATVRWDRYGLPGEDQHLSECHCVGDERPTCGTCKGTGRRMARVNVKNLERLRDQSPGPEYAPF